MPLVEIKMLISRNTSQGAKSKGDKVILPKREADYFVAKKQAKAIVAKEPVKTEPPKTIEEKSDVY